MLSPASVLHRPQKKHSPEVRIHAPELRRWISKLTAPSPADSPPGDFLITMVKETVIIYKKIVSKKKMKLVCMFH